MEQHRKEIALKKFRGVITTATKEGMNAFSKKIRDEIKELATEPEGVSQDIILVKERLLGKIADIVKSNKTFLPDDQNTEVSIGNRVKIKNFDGKNTEEEYFLDTVSFLECSDLLNVNSSLGLALFGMKKGEKGIYQKSGRNDMKFQVLEIYEYSKAVNMSEMSRLEQVAV